MPFDLKKDLEKTLNITQNLDEEERKKQLALGTKDVWSHLTDFRSILLSSGIYFVIFFFIAFSFHDQIFILLTDPLYDALEVNGFEKKIIFRKIQSAAMFQLETSFDIALVLIVPIIMLKIWQFISEGLYEAEKALAKKYAFLLLGIVIFFFSLGIFFAYDYLIPFTYRFLLSYAKTTGEFQLLPDIDLEDYLSFFTRMILGSGFIALTPIIMGILSLFNMVSSQYFISKWRNQFVIAFIISAVLTPTTDYMTQAVMAAPIIGFYWVGIAIALLIERSRTPSS